MAARSIAATVTLLLAAGAAPAAAAPVYALLGTGAVVRTTTSGGPLEEIARVSRTEFHVRGGGPYLVRSGAVLFAAFPGQADSLFAIDPATRASHRVEQWPGADIRALLVGATTHQIYVVANEPAVGGARLVIRKLSPDGRDVLAEHVVKHPAGSVYNAALSSDERRIAVAYHGDSQGFDLVDTATLDLGCHLEPVGGCLLGHGSVVFAGSRLFTSTGAPLFAELTPARALKRRAARIDAHIIEFATDPANRFLYMSGTCGYTHGISRFDLRRGTVKRLVNSPHGVLCGTRLLVSGDHLVLGANNPPYPDAGTTSYIRIASRRTGRLQRSIPTPGSIVDVATG